MRARISRWVLDNFPTWRPGVRLWGLAVAGWWRGKVKPVVESFSADLAPSGQLWPPAVLRKRQSRRLELEALEIVSSPTSIASSGTGMVLSEAMLHRAQAAAQGAPVVPQAHGFDVAPAVPH